MNAATASASRPAITKLLVATAVLLGLLGLFVMLAQGASAGESIKVTVNSTANTDDGDCEGAPNDGSGNCTLHEAIDAVNDGDADLINFHTPVFSKAQPGVINLCEDDGAGVLPMIERDIVIDSKDSGVILDGGLDDGDCSTPATAGLFAKGFGEGFDFTLNGGKNFEIRNMDSWGILICGGFCSATSVSLGTIEITGVIIDNVEDSGVEIVANNLESGSVTNSVISANNHGVDVSIDACAFDDCELDDSVLDISGNRIQGGVTFPEECCGAPGVDVEYTGVLSSKITVNISQNEVINGTEEGVQFDFVGCGSGGVNVHVDENGQINGGIYDGVDVSIFADACQVWELPPGQAGLCILAGDPICVDPGDTSDGFEAVVTVNGNGDIETEGLAVGGSVASGPFGEGVTINVFICCEESDSSATVEVNDNGRITGEDDGVAVNTGVCCGDDNSTDTSVNGNDEITGEGDDGIDIDSFAGGGGFLIGGTPGAAGLGFDADDNTCTITVDGNNEIDGVGDDGVEAFCFAGTFGFAVIEESLEEEAGIAGPPLSSGDGNVTTISVTNNSDIDGDDDGVNIDGIAGSLDGEADDNLATATVSSNGEITGDDSDGVEVDIVAGTPVEEGDDNATEIVIEGNTEIGGNGGEGLDLDSFAGGSTDGSESNSTDVSVVENGDIEGSGSSGEAIEIDSNVCCDSDNVNTININNNTGELTGHDDDGIDIETCCSVNIINILDNEGNIRGGDDDGLEITICDAGSPSLPVPLAGAAGGDFDAFLGCVKDGVTYLTVMSNSFSDSENDGINICCGAFEDDDIKSVISNNVIEGNGDDGIDIESSSGLNIGPNNEIFENGTEAGDNGVEIDWCLGFDAWGEEGNKLAANHNTITQNSIHGNFGLGIDLVGWDADNGCEEADASTVGCVPFTETSINPNDCIPFPDLQTQSGDKLIGTACSECTVEIFWADGGEGAEYIISGEADADGDFSIELPCDLGDGDLTATATDKLKNTSEFSETIVTLGTSGCATDTPEPTETPLPVEATDTPVLPDPTATPEPAKLCGDPNVDGSVNSIDATVILQLKAAMIDSLANESSADVNNSGSITSVDASLILQVTAGLIGEGALSCPA